MMGRKTSRSAGTGRSVISNREASSNILTVRQKYAQGLGAYQVFFQLLTYAIKERVKEEDETQKARCRTVHRASEEHLAMRTCVWSSKEDLLMDKSSFPGRADTMKV
jgi:hypothetical protein